MTPIFIWMVQSRPEAHSPIQSLCVKHTPLKKQRRERLLERKSFLGSFSHFGHLPIPLPLLGCLEQGSLELVALDSLTRLLLFAISLEGGMRRADVSPKGI